MPMRRADAVVPLVALLLTALSTADGCRKKNDGTTPPGPSAVPEAGLSPIGQVPDDDLPRGVLSFEVLDADTKKPIPCKLTFRGVGKTRNPRFSVGDVPVGIEGGMAAWSRVYSLLGKGSLRVPHGAYDVTVSHGPEWSIEIKRGVVVGAAGTRVAASLRHSVPTPGWVSADLHVHAAPSWDSTVPLGGRVLEFAAEAVDILVASDHNVLTDYTSAIADADAESMLSSVSGVELSTVDWGHFGAFPMKPDNDWWALRGVRMRGMPAADLLRGVRQRDPEALLSVNHPRLGKMGYFNRAEYNPASGRVGTPRASLDFDAVEIMNGYKDAQIDKIRSVLGDWFSLIQHGHSVVAIGNSDTHHLRYSVAGYPRNYVQVPDDGIGATSGDDLAQGIKEGRSYFTTGPILDVDIDGRPLGSVVKVSGKPVVLHVRLRAAPWIKVTEVSVLVDGKKAHSWNVPESTSVERLKAEHTLLVQRDAFVVVRVDGARSLAPVVGGGGILPVPVFALTNPIYLDFDGNGRYDAPLH